MITQMLCLDAKLRARRSAQNTLYLDLPGVDIFNYLTPSSTPFISLESDSVSQYHISVKPADIALKLS